MTNGCIALKSMIPVSDTIRDYLGGGMGQALPELWQKSFGQYGLYSADSIRLFSDFGESTVRSSMQLLSAGGAGMVMPFSSWIHSIFFLLFLFSFMLYAFVFRWEATTLKDSFKNILTLGKHSASIHKSQVTRIGSWGEFYLLFQAILIFSILLFSWLWSNGLSAFSAGEQLLSFVGIFVSIALLISLKIAGYKLIGTFFLQREMGDWTIYYSRMIEILGIIFFLPAVFYVYLHEIRKIILISLVLFFFISRLIIYSKLLNIFVKNKISPFYFFIYLCGTEIAPYLLLYKVVLFAITIADNII
jgi:hypothetical protein